MLNKVSVIIPIYNVEQYLEKCLDSVINQTYKNLEIICVNDCSSDNSLEILKKYTASDKRIQIVNRIQNGGSSATRHSGLDVATGEYIYFLDSDDWISLDYIEKMLKAITKYNQNAICCTNIVTVYEDGSNAQLIKRDFDEGIFPYYKSCQMPWSWLLKKSFLDKFEIIFPLGLKYEDTYFYNVLIRSLQNIYIINSTVYYHFENKNSVMGSSKNRTINDFDIIEITDLIYKYYKNNNLIDKWSIPFFYMPKYMLNIHGNKQEFFFRLKKLFIKMESDVFNNESLYSDLELDFFKNLISKENYNDFKKDNTSIIAALRKNIGR